MIRELTIKNYKSILDHTIELGRINVFIGENGCGKTNILEALAMAAAALTNKLGVEELFNRGMRVAKPSIMRSAFPGASSEEIVLRCEFVSGLPTETKTVELRISAQEDAADVKWVEQWMSKTAPELFSKLFDVSPVPKAVDSKTLEALSEDFKRRPLIALLVDFAIYNANALALRGLVDCLTSLST